MTVAIRHILPKLKSKVVIKILTFSVRPSARPIKTLKWFVQWSLFLQRYTAPKATKPFSVTLKIKMLSLQQAQRFLFWSWCISFYMVKVWWKRKLLALFISSIEKAGMHTTHRKNEPSQWLIIVSKQFNQKLEHFLDKQIPKILHNYLELGPLLQTHLPITISATLLLYSIPIQHPTSQTISQNASMGPSKPLQMWLSSHIQVVVGLESFTIPIFIATPTSPQTQASKAWYTCLFPPCQDYHKEIQIFHN